MSVSKDSGNLHAGHRDRLREKLARDPKTLADHELLELLLFGYIPYKDTNPVAHRLFDVFGGWQGLFDAELSALAAVPNMTYNAAVAVKAFAEAKARCAGEKIVYLRSPAEVVPYVASYFSGRTREELLLIGVGANGRVLYRDSVGSAECDSVRFDTREILAKAVTAKVNAILLCHNHPGGSARPSRDDSAATRRLAELLEGVGIRLLDHLIIAANGEIYSMNADAPVASGRGNL